MEGEDLISVYKINLGLETVRNMARDSGFEPCVVAPVGQGVEISYDPEDPRFVGFLKVVGDYLGAESQSW